MLAACLRIFAVPRFQNVPGKLQMLIELWVGTFSGMAQSNSPHHNKVLGPYIFGAGTYIFVSTLFEMFGLQAVTTAGRSIALPAPLSDINGAIAMGVLSYLFILSGGVSAVGLRGVGRTLKEFVPAHLHELPSVRRSAVRPAGDRTGLLLYHPQLCAAGDRRRHVHPCCTH